jgi:excisionase family DNA binding protein
MPTTVETTDGTRWVDVPTAASILDMSERTVRHLCAEGELPAEKFGRAWRIPRSAVMPSAVVTGAVGE